MAAYRKGNGLGRGGRGGVLDLMHGRSHMTIDPRTPTYAGTEHVGFGFSPTRQTLLAPSAKRREVRRYSASRKKGELLHPNKNRL